MSEELTPTELVLLPIEDQINHELVKVNVTEAVIADLRDRYMSLRINGIDDKETYLIVKEGRKTCKSLRVMASKICKNFREDYIAKQKASVAKEKEVTGMIAEIEDHLEVQEKEYEAEVDRQKEARKRKQEEQLIVRQQTLTNMGALYSDGNFTLGDVSFDLSLVKESDEDVWQEAIFPKFYEEYNKIELDRIAEDRKKQEAEAEFKRQQEELEQKKKELAEEAARLQQEAARQALEADKRRAIMIETRTNQITSLGFVYNGIEHYKFREYTILLCDIHQDCDADWNGLVADAVKYVEIIKAEEAEEKIKDQKRKELQNKRYAEMYPYAQYSYPVAMDSLWQFPEDKYLGMLEGGKAAFQKAEEERAKQIADAAAKKERERIEEEQRQAEVKRKRGLKEFRISALAQYNTLHTDEMGDLGEMSDDKWMILITMTKQMFDDLKRKQEEERKAEELAQASDKVKWESIVSYLDGLKLHDFRSGPYRKRAAILREKLEEIKAL